MDVVMTNDKIPLKVYYKNFYKKVLGTKGGEGEADIWTSDICFTSCALS